MSHSIAVTHTSHQFTAIGANEKATVPLCLNLRAWTKTGTHFLLHRNKSSHT